MGVEHGVGGGRVEPLPAPRRQRLHLLVGRTAGAVPGALAGGALAVGGGLPPAPAALLAIGGATLGAVAATGGRRRERPAGTRLRPGMVDGGGDTPPKGVSARP